MKKLMSKTWTWCYPQSQRMLQVTLTPRRDLLPIFPTHNVAMNMFLDFSILLWNIQGAIGCVTKRNIKQLVKSHQPSMQLLFKTHIQFSQVQKFWDSLGHHPIFLQETRGHPGGIWILSNGNGINFMLVDSTTHAITSKMNKTWVLLCNLWVS